MHPHVRAIFIDAADVVHEEPADAEWFASSFQQAFRSQTGPHPDEVLREALRVGGLVGLFIARSIRVFGPEAAHHRADTVFDKIAAKHTPPQWLLDMGNVTVGDVAMVRERYGDGYGIYLEYDDPLSGETRTIGVYIDVNMGVMAKDVVDGPALMAIRDLLVNEPQIEVVAIDAAEARARVEAAFAVLDEEPELELELVEDLKDLLDLRALAEQRYSLLPAGGSIPDERVELSDDDLDALVESFVNSSHFFGLPSVARDIGEIICVFSDSLDGDPLRWSPTVVEIFLVDWLVHEVDADEEFFLAVPDVVRAWIRFAGERKGLERELIDETVQSVDQWLDEYYEMVRSPELGGAAAELAAAMTRGGVDLDDERAVRAFVDDYNAGLSDVGVDLDLAEEGLHAQWAAFERQLVDLLKASLAPQRGAQPPDAAGDPDALLATVASWFAALDAETSPIGQTDLLRVVLTIAGAGAGTSASPEHLARVLEIDDEANTSAVRQVFEHYVTQWQTIGAVDAEHMLTPLGHWLLPRALARAWGGDFDSPS